MSQTMNINMSRTKRWVNMNSKKFNADGTLKPEAREHMLSKGLSEAAINDHALTKKKEYDEWKHLDETDPEPWPIYTAFDFFTDEEKQQFNPDGSLKPEYRERELASGTSENWLDEMERRKKLDVDEFNELSQQHEQQGINFGAWQMRSRVNASNTYLERLKQMQQDLANFEDPWTLPFDPDTSF